jgi:GT2 family glycosyltransferase
MKTGIVIPFFNHWDLTHALLARLYEFLAREDIEIILINDASTENDCETGVAWWQSWHSKPIYYYRNNTNLGVGGSMNIGAKLAIKHGAEVLVFLSNDVIVSSDFMPGIFNALAKDKNILIGGELIYWDGGWNKIEIEGKKHIIPYLNGWLLACTASIWRNLGGFDLLYGKYTYEDIDLSTKALSLGYNLVALNNPGLKHLGGGTISQGNADRIKITEENKAKYIQKWKPHFADIIQLLESRK